MTSKVKLVPIYCRECRLPIRKFTGAISEWWVHVNTKSQACSTGSGGIARPE